MAYPDYLLNWLSPPEVAEPPVMPAWKYKKIQSSNLGSSMINVQSKKTSNENRSQKRRCTKPINKSHNFFKNMISKVL